MKGTLDDDVTEADIISCVEFNQDGDLLATGDKGGRVVIFQRDPTVSHAIIRSTSLLARPAIVSESFPKFDFFVANFFVTVVEILFLPGANFWSPFFSPRT